METSTLLHLANRALWLIAALRDGRSWRNDHGDMRCLFISRREVVYRLDPSVELQVVVAVVLAIVEHELIPRVY